EVDVVKAVRVVAARVEPVVQVEVGRRIGHLVEVGDVSTWGERRYAVAQILNVLAMLGGEPLQVVELVPLRRDLVKRRQRRVLCGRQRVGLPGAAGSVVKA